MLEVPSVNVEKPNFKADTYQRPIQQAPLPPMGRDSFELMSVQKKADNKDKWMKAGVLAGVGCAIAFGIQALISLATHKVNKQVAAEQMKTLKEQAAYFARQGSEKTEQAIKTIYEDISKATKIEDMALSDDLKQLAEQIKYTVENRETIIERGGETVNSILFYGPPGTGKTTIAKAISNMFPKAKFATLDVTKMKDKYVGETEKNINAIIDKICADADAMMEKYNKELGEVIGKDIVERGNEKEIAEAIAKARKEGKQIPEMERIFVFADEIDSVMMVDTGSGAKISNDMLNEFKKGFTEKLGKRRNVITLGATNLEIDAKKAATADGKQLDRPMLDRFDLHIRVGNPTAGQLKQTMTKRYAQKSLVDDALKDVNSTQLDELCQFLEAHDISFRKLNAILKKAGGAVKKDGEGNIDPNAKITMMDLIDAIKSMKESLNIRDDNEIIELIAKLNRSH